MKRIASLTVLLLALSALILIRQSNSLAQDVNPGAFRIGFVNFNEVFHKYEKTLVVEEQLKEYQAGLNRELKEMQKQGREITEQLRTLKEGSVEYINKEKKLRHLETDVDSFMKEGERAVEEFYLHNMEQIYIDIREVVEGYGKENQYTLVLKVENMDIESMHSNTFVSLNQKIQARPILYYRKDFDITQAVLDKLNEEYDPNEN